MAIKLYNTLSKQKQVFEPLNPDCVTMYVCGPTVYSYAHIGNARPAVVFDVLVKLLRKQYKKVIYARNLTDVDDKINAAANEQGVEIDVVTNKFTNIYHQDMGSLGVDMPDIEPRATDHIGQIISMIEGLINKGFAYEAEQHVMFNVPAYKAYGELSGRNREDMIAGARVEVAPYKKDPADFVLWKPSTPDQPSWQSPWGAGRPGWHIECSAMIEKHLGNTIDIHGGGQDLIFPHHENEIAQSTCAHDHQVFCRYWIHNGFVNVNYEKMSKSIGNVLLVHDLLKNAPGEAVRYALLSTHYRSPLDWTDELLTSSKKCLDRLYGALEELASIEATTPAKELTDKFYNAVKEDLNTPLAFSELHALAKLANNASDDQQRAELKGAMLECGQLLGLLQQQPSAWFGVGSSDLDEVMIDGLITQRNQARSEKDFASADRIRDQLAEMGIEILDRPEGTSWRKI
ncbi:MAG: cysteine--tRNA ligase [Gammaproteobacteria bacterium]|nr:cysteine--tRNA ligase [Gammaproteobacteria bacterium]